MGITTYKDVEHPGVILNSRSRRLLSDGSCFYVKSLPGRDVGGSACDCVCVCVCVRVRVRVRACMCFPCMYGSVYISGKMCLNNTMCEITKHIS